MLQASAVAQVLGALVELVKRRVHASPLTLAAGDPDVPVTDPGSGLGICVDEDDEERVRGLLADEVVAGGRVPSRIEQNDHVSAVWTPHLSERDPLRCESSLDLFERVPMRVQQLRLERFELA